LDVDLSVRQQLLDVVIVRRGQGTKLVPWPDGFENPAEHNLLTFKSLQEPLDRWAIQELIGHYVNYRKQQSASRGQLLPETHFALFAAAMRFPRDLANDVAFQERGPGVYDITCLGGTIRVLVLSQAAEAERNALWNLFSGNRERVSYALKQLRPRLQYVSSVLNDLLSHYNQEGIHMPYTVEEVVQEINDRIIRDAPVEKRLAGLSPEEILKALPLEQLLARLTPEQLARVRAYLDQRSSDTGTK
jgi:hypothetical protein